MGYFFYYFVSILGLLSITFDELSETHQAGWHIYHENLDSAEVLFQDALKEYQDYLDTRREVVALLDLASVYHQKGKFAKYLQYLHTSEKLINQFEDSLIFSSLYAKLYNAYSTMNDVDKALEYLKKQKLYIAEEDSSTAIGYYINIADIYMKMGSYDLAKENLDLANSLTSLADGNKKLIFNKYGYFFYRTDQPDSALNYFERAMVYYDAWNNKVDLTSLLNYLSIKQELKGNVSISTLDSVFTVIQKHDLKGDLPQFYAIKANVLQDTAYMHKAIQLSSNGRNFQFTLDLIKDLADLQFNLKHFDEHKATLELYHNLKDSVSQERNKHLVKDLSSSYSEDNYSNNSSNSFLHELTLYIALIMIFILVSYIIYSQYYQKNKRSVK